WMQRLDARVTARLVAWHRALSRELFPLDPVAKGRAALERVSAELELDLLTDGWFGARVRKLPLPRVERREPGPKIPAAPKPASNKKSPTEDPVVADFTARPPSATSSAMLAEARNGLQDLLRRVDALRGSL
ncbi:MAG TPA: hypothetical protein VMI54_25595, partial [Polyangiaceae bacterium]|nr:hypothetical protein [Polyangiaceae bacterium]